MPMSPTKRAGDLLLDAWATLAFQPKRPERGVWRRSAESTTRLRAAGDAVAVAVVGIGERERSRASGTASSRPTPIIGARCAG